MLRKDCARAWWLALLDATWVSRLNGAVAARTAVDATRGHHRGLGTRCRRVLATRTFITPIRSRLVVGDQVVGTIADQVITAHGLERIAQQWPVVGVVITQEGLVQAAALFTLDDVDLLAFASLTADALERVQARVVHRRGRGHGAGVEGLDLVSLEAVALEPDGQVHHVFIGGAGVGCDEVRDKVLLFAGFFAELLKHLFEAVIRANARLHHLGQGPRLGVLGRNLEVAAHMVGDQFFDVLRRAHGQVVTQA